MSGLFVEVIAAVEHGGEVRSWVLRNLSLDDLSTLAAELVAADRGGRDLTAVLASWVAAQEV